MFQRLKLQLIQQVFDSIERAKSYEPPVDDLGVPSSPNPERQFLKETLDAPVLKEMLIQMQLFLKVEKDKKFIEKSIEEIIEAIDRTLINTRASFEKKLTLQKEKDQEYIKRFRYFLKSHLLFIGKLQILNNEKPLLFSELKENEKKLLKLLNSETFNPFFEVGKKNHDAINALLDSLSKRNIEAKPLLPIDSKVKSVDRLVIVDSLLSTESNKHVSETYLTKKLKADNSFQQNKKTKEDNLYYLKNLLEDQESVSPELCCNAEMISQEFFRLLLGDPQPKTRRVVTDDNQTYGVISKSISNFSSFAKFDMKGKNIPYEIQQLLAGIIEVSRTVKETDLKSGNMGTDKEGKPVKIDGSCSFPLYVTNTPEKKTPENFKRYFRYTRQVKDITAKDLRNSPNVYDLKVQNWFRIMVEGDKNPYAFRLVEDNKLRKDPVFQNNSHDIRLQLILMDKSMIEHFVKQYTDNPDHQKKFASYLNTRIEVMKEEVLTIPAFRQFLNDDKLATTAKEKLVTKLKNFTTIKKNKLYQPEKYPDLETSLQKQLQYYKERSNKIYAAIKPFADYIENREKNDNEYFGFFAKHFSKMSRTVKVSAADKMIKLITGKSIQDNPFTELELRALIEPGSKLNDAMNQFKSQKGILKAYPKIQEYIDADNARVGVFNFRY